MSSFQPNWACLPGDTISDFLRERNWTVNSFAKKMDCSTDYIEALIAGQEKITKDIASKLEVNLGSTASFWLRREEQYRQDLARITIAKQEQEAKKWLRNLPLSDLVSFGWIKQHNDFQSKLKACLNFFGVPSIEDWKKKYCDMITIAAYRTSPTFTPRLESVAAWLRQGELKASEIKCKPWNIELFKSKLLEIRRLTRKRAPKEFIPELINMCAECGVAVAIVRTPQGCQASGATYFISPTRAIMLLSFRYLSDDQFWFTFFHEAGHLVLHGPDAVFIEETRKDRTITKEEEEANEFASNLLIPPKIKAFLRKMPINKQAILRVSVAAGVSRGIVVGQLQHMGRIDFSKYNAYKRRYNWSDLGQ
jgi:HTH-type transcriptional regulator / antitoxin HigA